jgi:hypothetical protein
MSMNSKARLQNTKNAMNNTVQLMDPCYSDRKQQLSSRFWGKCTRMFAVIAVGAAINGAAEAASLHTEGADGFHLNGVASKISSTRIQLSPEVGGCGTAMSNTPLSLLHPFDLQYNLYFGAHPGADGIGFILHNDPRGNAAIGIGGGDLGFADSTTGHPAAITNSVAVRWPTYYLEQQYTQFYQPTDSRVPAANLGGGTVAISGLSDGLLHSVQLTWDPTTHTLTQRFNGSAPQSVNLGANFATDYFGGSSNVYFGLGAGTGSLTNLQAFEIVQQTYAAVILPTAGFNIPLGETLVQQGQVTGVGPLVVDGGGTIRFTNTSTANPNNYTKSLLLKNGSMVEISDANQLPNDPIYIARGPVNVTQTMTLTQDVILGANI